MISSPFLILGIFGMILVLIAFFLCQRHIISQDDFSYDVLNFCGSFFLVLYAINGHAWPFVILNSIWALCSLFDIFRDLVSVHQKR